MHRSKQQMQTWRIEGKYTHTHTHTQQQKTKNKHK